MERLNEQQLRDLNEYQRLKKLPPFFRNARTSLSGPMPSLMIGEHGVETTSYAGKSKKHYRGPLSLWGNFQASTAEFYQKLGPIFERCSHLPLNIDPSLKFLHQFAEVDECIQVGGEITLSGRFISNGLVPLISATRTLAHELSKNSKPQFYLPRDLRFGDSWIIKKKIRVKGNEPDLVLRTQPGNDDDGIRLVAELKSCVTMDLKAAMTKALQTNGNNNDLRAILGQIVDYMINRKLRYGFLSNYKETIFLAILSQPNDGKPCVAISEAIPCTNYFDLKAKTISTRMGLLYLLSLSCMPQDLNWWRTEHTSNLSEKWIYQKASRVIIEMNVPVKHNGENESEVDLSLQFEGFSNQPQGFNVAQRERLNHRAGPRRAANARNERVKRGGPSSPNT
ncbi:hypothetical protein B0J11DRAFT_574545 [Dendryphion nanum]|uniref:Uncharacterized protein n=1 Tax=Dendryphion nanum TaxID=256645 RepID=A0A9P9EK82_9PLEO|nr:hypothetical protein B0J11DRAFT_574545 [Dendryphion nanum]